MKWLVVCLTAIGSLSTPFAWAENAQVSGRVMDQSGGVVPTAKIVVVNEHTRVGRSTYTNDDGIYSVSSLLPGAYSVSVQVPGFRTVMRTGITLEVGQNARVDFTIEAAATEEVVTVSADASRINTTDATVGTVIDRQFVENLPMNGRSFQSLILLTPGIVTNSPQSTATVGFGGEFSVNGQRTESNRFTVDGVSANNGTYALGFLTTGSSGGLPTGTAMGTTQSLVSLDALQEFRVSSSSYSAEFGRSPGGQVSFVTRSGTNDLHGSLFEYVRNDALNANDWFNNRLAVAKPVERQNDFGGTLGGPLMIPRLYNGRDRTFFFFSYEGLRIKQPLPATVVYVPSLALRQEATGALRDVLNAYPLPTGTDLPNGLSEYIMTDSVPSDLDSTALRVDHSAAASLRFFFRSSYAPSDTVSRVPTLLQNYLKRRFEPHSHTFGATSVISNSMTNELRVGYSSNQGSNEYLLIDRDGSRPVDLFGVHGMDLNREPGASVFVALFFSGANSGVVEGITAQPQTQWNVTDTLDFIVGRHRFKAGVDFLRTASTLQRNDPNVTFVYPNRAAVLENRASVLTIARYGRAQPVFTSFGAFVQDEWRIADRLSLSLGLRWEVNPAPVVSDGTLPRIPSGSVSLPSTLALAPEGTSLWKTTYRNFAPRLGLAYTARESAGFETVVRAGGGVFFDGPHTKASVFDANPGMSMVRNSFGTTASYPLTPAQWNLPLSASLVPPYGAMFAFGDDTTPFELPYTVQWNASLEQALGSPQSLAVSYVGARGQRLLGFDTRNVSALNRDFTSVTIVEGSLTSSYDALQARFQRRLSRGFQALLSYTWSHAIDHGSDSATLPAKRGNSAFDVRHSFSAAATYEIPAFRSRVARALLSRWNLDARFAARSAFPVTLNGATLTDVVTGQQFYGGLDLVPDVALYLEKPDVPGGRQINPAAFKLPVGSQVGTAPRNFVRGFGATQLDTALHRDFPLSGTFRIQLRLEGFNVLNHPNFGVVNSNFGNPQFGQAIRTLNNSLGGLNALYQQGGPRSMQASLRLVF